MIRAHLPAICSLVLAGWCVGAQAQVTRCTDARTGKVTYTDGACNSREAAREVEPRRSPEEILLDRQLSAEALERKQQRQQAENDAADAEARRADERNRARAANAPLPQDYARSPECARSRRSYDMLASEGPRSTQEHGQRLEAAQRQMDLDCLGPQGYAEVERARAAQPRVVVVPPRYGIGYPAPYPPPAVFPQPFPTTPQQPPPRLTQCSDYRCTDNQGNTYPRNGPGRFPGSGGVCRSNGGQAPC
ncbi:DUF4124 domain-containing protein [Acidovorax sp. Root219]|uniref:DUF4124 domain-containing protein n=1 Tax=Acidovorax sp. Root219 TaxID=1736493 RepID=UPI00070E9B19|nr:DUF4124 domain-containing protein [Acidovorax sp. Root219]KRC33405.1 hypothetical protein ASE28_09415 [Acidovorax sp. Root219]